MAKRFTKADFSELTTGDLAALTLGQQAVIAALADGDSYEVIAAARVLRAATAEVV